MNLLQVQNAVKAFAARRLFDGCTFAINEGEHVGVIGPNGAGKSTLFKIIVGVEGLDEGQVVKSQSLRLGYLAQEDNWQGCQTGAEYLERHCRLPMWDLYRFAHDLGLSKNHLDGPITALSGGYRMRLKLVHLIGNEPNLMLLDEPTNYLDLETLLVLEQFLLGYEGAFLLISHDREFLRRVTDHTLEVEDGQVTKFNGHIDDYFEQKELLGEQLRARALSLSAKRQAVLDFAARFGAKATKARQAQSRLKRLSKMESIDLKPLPTRARIVLPEPMRTSKQICAMKMAGLGYGEKVILRDVNLELSRGDHLAIVGYNGVGKSTLLKVLASELEPLSGEYRVGVQIGYYAQHVSEGLYPDHTVLEALAATAHPEVGRQDILNLAGSLLFSGDDVNKKIRILSGGEKSRVALGRVLLQKAPFLLLDEPTNHLDFNTVEALTQALANYSGTLVVVSHDRSFVRRVATRILEIQNGHVDLYPGTYDEYVWSLEKGFFAQKSAGADERPTTMVSPMDPPRASNYKEQRKALDKKLRALAKDIQQYEVQVAKLQAQVLTLNEELMQAAGEHAQSLGRELSQAQSMVDAFERQWLQALEDKELCEFELAQLTGME